MKLSQSLGKTLEAAQEHDHDSSGAIDMNASPGEQYLQMLEAVEEQRKRYSEADTTEPDIDATDASERD